MSKFTINTNFNEVGEQEALRSGVVEQLRDNLPSAGQAVVQPTAPVVSPADAAFKELTPPTPEEAEVLEQRQMDIEEAQSVSDLYGTTPIQVGPVDIQKIYGPLRSKRVIDGYNNIKDTDSIRLPENQKERTKTLKSMLGAVRTPEEIEALGDINFVDEGKTKPLNNAELFGHLNAYQEDSSSLKGFKVTPGLQVLALGVVEQNLMDIIQAEEILPDVVTDNFTSEEIEKMTGLDPESVNSTSSDGRIGRVLTEEWLKESQRESEGPDVRLTWHLDPERKLTKEGYEHLGVWAQQTYSLAYPEIFEGVKVPTTEGKKRTVYSLTPDGKELLNAVKEDILPPQVKARPQVTADPQSTTKYSDTKKETGFHKTGEAVVEKEAQKNLASVRHVVTRVRRKVGMFLSLMGLSAASGVYIDPDTGDLVISNSVGSILGIGKDTVNKINNTSAVALLQRDSLQAQLKDMSDYDPRREGILNKAAALEDFARVSADPRWKLKTYMFRATQALGMLQDIAEFSGDPISFTNYLQRGTSRISYSSQKMNIQNHKMARQMYGSGTQYIIVPGSGSDAEWSMLVTMGGHLFGDWNSTPNIVYQNMRRRIQEKDPKVMAIASVGSKMKEILSSYNERTTIDQILKMDLKDGNTVTGVKEVLDTRVAFKEDPEVFRFINKALEHPNEAINMIEEAIELHNYVEAVESGGRFSSTMRPLEVDGISNGLAGLAMQLGIRDIMYRVGVLRENPNKVLAEYEGIEGNLRAVLASNMELDLPSILKDKNFKKAFNLSGDLSQYSEIKTLLDLAISNDKLFLKPPLMTFAYGQAISSMRGLMLDTVIKTPALSEAARRSPWGEEGVAKMLHRILESSLTKTVGPEVVEFTEALKDVTALASVADEPIVFKLATGTQTSVNASVFQTDSDAKPIDVRIKGPDNKEVTRSEYQPTKRVVSGIEGGSASSNTNSSNIRTKILAQAAISFDGSTIALALSGKNYKALQSKTNQKVPYVATIYDAVVGDLGSFKHIMESTNRVWKDATLGYDLIDQLAKGSGKAYSRGLKKLTENAASDPRGFAKNRDQVLTIIGAARDIVDQDGPSSDLVRRTLFEATITKDLNISNKDLLDIYKSLSPEMNAKYSRLNKISLDAAKRRKALVKELSDSHVYQYSPDALKGNGIDFT